jgi:hypothetical protein
VRPIALRPKHGRSGMEGYGGPPRQRQRLMGYFLGKDMLTVVCVKHIFLWSSATQ